MKWLKAVGNFIWLSTAITIIIILVLLGVVFWPLTIAMVIAYALVRDKMENDEAPD